LAAWSAKPLDLGSGHLSHDRESSASVPGDPDFAAFNPGYVLEAETCGGYIRKHD